MIQSGHKIFVVLLLLVVSLRCPALVPPSSSKSRSNGVRISFGPVLGFYSVNSHHAKDPQQKMSALISFKKEKRLSRDYQSFFLFGVDYFFHGLNFQSYYFKPDSLQLYDKDFAYKYSVFIHEINVPLQFKYSFSRENNSMFSPYIMIGYHLRYLLPGSLKVTQNGNLIKSDNADMQFEHSFITKQMNAFVSASIGWQKNNTAASNSGFFVELNYRYGFSAYYFDKSYAASSLFINGTHLTLQLGLKF